MIDIIMEKEDCYHRINVADLEPGDKINYIHEHHLNKRSVTLLVKPAIFLNDCSDYILIYVIGNKSVSKVEADNIYE